MALSFRDVEGAARTDAEKDAWVGASPFVAGLGGGDNDHLQIKDYGFVTSDGKNHLPILKVYLGVVFVGNLFVSSLTKTYVKKDGSTIKAQGDVVDLVRKTIAANAGKTNKEVLDAIIAAVGNRDIKVERTEYTANGKFGDVAKATIDLYFKQS